MHHSRLITSIESENMESTMAYGEEEILKEYRLPSPSIDRVFFRAISPLNIPLTDVVAEKKVR